MRKTFLAVVAAALMTGSVSAHATVFSGIFHGTITSGVDGTNTFGLKGASMAGQTISGMFIYDTDKLVQTLPGVFLGNGVSFYETINGHTTGFGSGLFGGSVTELDLSTIGMDDVFAATAATLKSAASLLIADDNFLHPFTEGQLFRVDNPDVGFGTGMILGGTLFRLPTKTAYEFKIDYAQVPEPATLALLGTGLLGAGLFGRRRKSA